MKHTIKAAALLVLFASSPLAAEEKYGPVLKVKPQGVAETGASSSGPGAPGSVKNSQGSQPAVLLVPAVQKARAGAHSGSANEQEPEAGGGLDRDIIRRIPGKPKPTK